MSHPWQQPTFDHIWAQQQIQPQPQGPPNGEQQNGAQGPGVMIDEAWGRAAAGPSHHTVNPPTGHAIPPYNPPGQAFYQPGQVPPQAGPSQMSIPRQSGGGWIGGTGSGNGMHGALGTNGVIHLSSSMDNLQQYGGMPHDGPSNQAQDPQSEGNDASGSSAPSLKRGMACTFCRRRKLKCSGVRPKCSSCIRYAQECEYAPPVKMQKHKALETKISELSDFIRQSVPPGEMNHPPQHFNPAATFDPSGLPSYPYYQSHSDIAQPVDPYPTEWNPDGFMTFPNEFPDTTPLPPAQSGPNTAFTMQLSDSFQPTNSADGYGYAPEYENAGPMLVSDLDACQGTPPAGGSGTPSRKSTEIRPPSVNATANSDTYGFVPSPTDRAAGVSASLANAGNDIPIAHPPAVFPSAPSIPTIPHQSYFYTPLSQTQSQTTSSSDPVARDQTNAQQKATAAKYFKTPRQTSLPRSSPSAASTPDSHIGPPLNSTVDPKSPNPYGRPLPAPGMWYGAQKTSLVSRGNLSTSHIDPIDGITESLGEFLFNPVSEGAGSVNSSASGTPSGPEENVKKKRRGTITSWAEGGGSAKSRNKSLIKIESDGMTDSARELLLDCFLAHSRLFFEMSIPRFRYRMTFNDRRRPAPALLYAMYLWATRMSNAPQTSPMEEHFFTAACRALDISSANADRLIDCMRASALLSAYCYTSGRYHEGWLFAGVCVRLVLSTGLHQIRSCVYQAEPARDPFLRGKTYLLPPPEDATELAERISTFWAIIAIERCGALATGFPGGISDHDIVTPFPRAFADIASRTVTQHDDLTIRDLYRSAYFQHDADPPLTKWLKATVILERASKLAFIDPEEDSEYGRAWSQYFSSSPSNPLLTTPPPWLDQPKYRCPKDYAEVKLALDQFRESMGADGVFPVDRIRNAKIDGVEEPSIIPHTIMLHHQFAATHMFLHDINAQGVENKEALVGVRRAVAMIRHLPPLPLQDIDSFCITIWSIIAKVLCKELRRLALAQDPAGIASVGEDVDLFVTEMQRVGVVMQLARSQAKAITEMKRQALDIEIRPAGEAEEEYRHRVRQGTSLPMGNARPAWGRADSDE